MALWIRLRSLLRNLAFGNRVERDLDDEVRGYLDLLAEEKMAGGMPADRAHREARLELGGAEQVKESVRDVRAGALVAQIARDVRYALRTLGRAPAFTLVVVLTLALGIGANTAIFSVIDAVMLRPLPIRDPSSVVALRHGEGPPGGFSYLDYLDYREQVQTLEGMAAWGGGRAWFRDGADLERASTQFVTGRYFEVLGVRAALGRTFGVQDEQADGPQPVAVLSEGFWRRRFGADPGVVGRAVTMNGRAFTIVGVAPAGFTGLDPMNPPDVWVPVAALRWLEPDWAFEQRDERWMHIVARAKPGVSVAQAQDSLQPLAAAAERAAGRDAAGAGVRLVPASTAVVDPDARAASRRIAWLLEAVVTCVLLIACANVANLALARSTARRRELGVRLALGATRGRVARQVITESLVLSLLGGIAGLAVAHWTVGLLVALSPAAAIPPGVTIGIDARVLLFALVVSVVTGVLFGVAPVVRVWRLDALPIIRNAPPASRRAARGLSPGRRVLVGAQVGLSVVLLVGAALFVRTFAAASAVNAGYDVDRVLLLSLDFTAANIEQPEASALMRRITERVVAIPGVEAASFGQIVPFSGAFIRRPVVAEGQSLPEGGGEYIVPYSVVAPGYFDTMGTPLRGRDFTVHDDDRSPRVVVVNETLAARLWPGEEAIGKRLRLPLRDAGPPYEVVAVAQDSRYVSLTEAQHPYLYLPLTQHHRPRLALHVRTTGTPASFAPEVRAALREAVPHVPAYNAVTLQDHVARTLSGERLLAWLLSVFGMLALAIAAVGIYGVLAYSVTRRTREIGVRMALGARPADIIRMVAAQSAGMIGAGLVAGLAATLAVTRLVTSFLFGVTPTDPLAFAGALGLLLLAAALATGLSARRATAVDPLVALRSE